MSIEYVSPKIASHLRSLARDVAYTEGHASVMRAAADRIEALEAERGHFKRFWHDSEAECRGVRERLDEARTRIEALEARLERATGDSARVKIQMALHRAYCDGWPSYCQEDAGAEGGWWDESGIALATIRAVVAEESAPRVGDGGDSGALSATPQNPVTGSYTVRTSKTARNGGAGFAADEQEADRG